MLDWEAEAKPVPGETQEEQGLESLHSAQSLHAPQALPLLPVIPNNADHVACS